MTTTTDNPLDLDATFTAAEPAVGPLDRETARKLTDEARQDARRLWLKLVDLYDREAHLALGYSSWEAYFRAEFGGQKSHAYRLLDAGRVAKALGLADAEAVINESQARELAPLLDDPPRMLEVITEASKDGPPTAQKIRAVLQPGPARAPSRQKAPRLEDLKPDWSDAVFASLERSNGVPMIPLHNRRRLASDFTLADLDAAEAEQKATAARATATRQAIAAIRKRYRAGLTKVEA
jgi:hypothetical protein